jgi:hypothetical protein
VIASCGATSRYGRRLVPKRERLSIDVLSNSERMRRALR